MTEAEQFTPNSMTTHGEPPAIYQISLNEDRTQRLILHGGGREWHVDTCNLRKYLDFQGNEKMTETQRNEMMSVLLFAGELYVFIHHETFRKKSLKDWERNLIKESKFRDICALFDITPEDLQWSGCFNPSYVSKPDWKEPITIPLMTIQEQAEKYADKIREILAIESYLKKEHPDFSNFLKDDKKHFERGLKELLSFEDISIRTDPDEIPKWAWKRSSSYRCTKRRDKDLWSKYESQGIITSE